ncbi:hypothetical protein GCM10010240_31780 [Streptomyces griseoviridis]|nr:hypothetical protein GCM10010240_31780 [Streptomyces griseoviridis]
MAGVSGANPPDGGRCARARLRTAAGVRRSGPPDVPVTEADKGGFRFLSHHLPPYPRVTDQTGGPATACT